jgi:hypothetical protein
MADDTRDMTPEAVDEALSDMKLEERDSDDLQNTISVADPYADAPTPSSLKRSQSPTPQPTKSESRPLVKLQSASQTPKSEYDEGEDVVGGQITVTVELGKAPKLLRKASQKIIARPAPLFDHLPDVTSEAIEAFQIIEDCMYGSKGMGSSEHDALDCDCSEEWSRCSTQPKFGWN